MRLTTSKRTAIALGALALILAGLAGPAVGGTGSCLGLSTTIPSGGSGPDEIHGTPGDDVIDGGGGDDYILGYGGNDTICGGPGNDGINGGLGDDLLDAGEGSADQAQYWSAPGAVIASLANGYADWADGRDKLIGFERLVGSEFDDILIGDAGSNSFIGLGRNDRIDGGPGVDSVKYNWRYDPVYVNLLTGMARGQGNDELKSIEAAVGTENNDILIGNGFPNTLSGLGGSDTLDGGLGGDRLEGGDGYDEVDYQTRSAPLTVSIDGLANDGAAGEGDNVWTDVERVLGGSGNDRLTGSGAANQLWGLGGNDTLTGGLGVDSLYGGLADDTFYARDGVADALVQGEGGWNRAQIDPGIDIRVFVQELF